MFVVFILFLPKQPNQPTQLIARPVECVFVAVKSKGGREYIYK